MYFLPTFGMPNKLFNVICFDLGQESKPKDILSIYVIYSLILNKAFEIKPIIWF